MTRTNILQFLLFYLFYRAVLEHELRKFSCLTKGDQITITYDNTKYNIEVKDLKPANACSIIETDCQVDFVEPPNWAEEEAKWKKKTAVVDNVTKPTSSTTSSDTKDTIMKNSNQEDSGQTTGKRKAEGTPVKERVGTLDLAKLAAERAERRAILTGASPKIKSFSGSGRRVDGRKKKISKDEPPPAPQSAPLTISAPKPGAGTGRMGALKRFRKRKEDGKAFGGVGASTGSGE